MPGPSSGRLTAALATANSFQAKGPKLQAPPGGQGRLLPLNLPSDGGGGWSGQQRRCLLYLPSTYRPGVEAPFILTLHGAGGSAEGGWTEWAPRWQPALPCPASTAAGATPVQGAWPTCCTRPTPLA